MSQFTWDRLLCDRRIAYDGTHYPLDDDRNSVFNKDGERILTSSAFRRLQGKTQVYPLPETDFVRNRLTHTFEVAHIGQTIAKRISKTLVLDYDDAEAFSQLIFNGCLLHDIGNPPFGHSGESSVREFFGEHGEGQKLDLVNYAFKNERYQKDLVLPKGLLHSQISIASRRIFGSAGNSTSAKGEYHGVVAYAGCRAPTLVGYPVNPSLMPSVA